MRVSRTHQHRASGAATGTFELILEDEARAPKTFQGYDPYETQPGVRRPGSSERHADLRRLSEWIRLKRQVAQIKQSDPVEPAAD